MNERSLLRHIRVFCTVASVALTLSAQTLRAQDASRPTPRIASPGDTSEATVADGVLRTVRGHLDAEQYAQALQLANDYLRTTRVPRRARLELLQAAAAAAYPSASFTANRPDSAFALLRSVVRLEPEATLYEEYRWSGLDSLLTQARAQTFGAAVRWQSRYELVGDFAPATFDVVATRPVKATLLLQRQGVGAPLAIDSAAGARALTLKLFAHDGTTARISEGSWFLQVVVVDSATGDSIVTPRVAAFAEGTSPTLMPSDVALDTTRLLPEWQPPARVTGIGMGIVMAAGAVAIASAARAPNMRQFSSVDGRAISVGVVGGLGAVIAGWFDRGRPLRENIARNKAVRDEHEYRNRFIKAFNRTNVANFRVKLSVAEEGRS